MQSKAEGPVCRGKEEETRGARGMGSCRHLTKKTGTAQPSPSRRKAGRQARQEAIGSGGDGTGDEARTTQGTETRQAPEGKGETQNERIGL